MGADEGAFAFEVFGVVGVGSGLDGVCGGGAGSEVALSSDVELATTTDAELDTEAELGTDTEAVGVRLAVLAVLLLLDVQAVAVRRIARSKPSR